MNKYQKTLQMCRMPDGRKFGNPTTYTNAFPEADVVFDALIFPENVYLGNKKAIIAREPHNLAVWKGDIDMVYDKNFFRKAADILGEILYITDSYGELRWVIGR